MPPTELVLRPRNEAPERSQTIARRFGHPKAGTPLTPTLCASSMKASTIGENLRSCQTPVTGDGDAAERYGNRKRFSLKPVSNEKSASRQEIKH